MGEQHSYFLQASSLSSLGARTVLLNKEPVKLVTLAPYLGGTLGNIHHTESAGRRDKVRARIV